MERRIMKLQKDFIDLFYNNKEIKKFLSKKLKSRSTYNTTKRTTNPNTSSRSSGTRAKTWLCERATENTEDCFVSPAVTTVKKDKSVKIALDSRKLNEDTVKRETQMPNK